VESGGEDAAAEPGVAAAAMVSEEAAEAAAAAEEGVEGVEAAERVGVGAMGLAATVERRSSC